MLGVLVLAGAWPAAHADRFLAPEEAFRLSVERSARDRVALRFDIAPGYYMYRASFAVQAEGLTTGALELPPGVVKFDENFGKKVETYHRTLRFAVPLPGAPEGPVTLTVQSQGCAEAGLCYPLATTRVQVAGLGQGAMPAAAPQAGPTSGGAAGSTGLATAATAASSLAMVAAASPTDTAASNPTAERPADGGPGRQAGMAALVALSGVLVGMAAWWMRRRR